MPENFTQYINQGCGRCKLANTPECKVNSWKIEIEALRAIILQTSLTETIKWSVPCYTYDGKNVLLLSALKESVVVSFVRGAELTDPEKILEKPGKNSRFARYLRITNQQTISPLKSILQHYITEAINLETNGKRPAAKQVKEIAYPLELLDAFQRSPRFKQAFTALTPGRKRGYLIYYSSAKQSKTRFSRIEKTMPRIFDGKGWNER